MIIEFMITLKSLNRFLFGNESKLKVRDYDNCWVLFIKVRDYDNSWVLFIKVIFNY
jgi:hypothetical protein